MGKFALRMFSMIFALILFFQNEILGQMISLQQMGNGPKSSVFIQDIKEGKVLGSGTAFQVVYSTSPSGDEYRFLVTALHVIRGADSIQVLFNRNLNMPDRLAGKPEIVSLPVPLTLGNTSLWQPAPDGVDIAVVFLSRESQQEVETRPQRGAQYMEETTTSPASNIIWIDNPAVPIPADIAMSLPDEDLADIYYSGYPLGLHGQYRIQAFTHRCTVALPSTKGLPFSDISPYDFLVDCAPFEGDSGSPVFIRSVFFRGNGTLAEIKTQLAGVMSGYVSWNQISKATSETLDTEIDLEVHKKNMLGLGYVAPARYILLAIQNFLSRVAFK